METITGSNPVLTTLIKLNFITMKESDKWCIKITPENREAIEKWRTADVTLKCYGYCVNKNSFNSMIGYWSPDKPSGYTEISFEEFKVYTNKPKDLTGRYVKCLVDGAQGTKCKAGEIYKLVSLDNVETQIYKLEDGFCLSIIPTTTDRWELLPEDYSANKPLKQAVYCETQEEWDFACDKYNKTDVVKRQFGKDYNSFNYNNKFSGWTTSENFIKQGYQILSFQEWCDLNGYKMEKSKQEILKEFAEKYPPGTKVKSPDGIEFIISTTHKHKGENNDFLQSSPYYTGLRGEVLAVKENSCIGEYLYKDGKYAEIIKDAPKFEVGKWYSFNWDWHSSNSTIIAKIKEINEDSFSISWRSYLWEENDYSIFDRYNFRNVSNIKKLSIDEVQQYLPDNHPDKTKSNQEFKVGDYVVLQYSSAKEIGYDTTSNNTRLKAGHIDKIANFRDGQTWSENSKIRWVGLESDPHNGVIEILLRHATQEEINNYLISIGQIQGNQEFKVGDWVVVLEEDNFYSNSEKCPQKLMEIKKYNLPYRLLFKDGHNNSYEKIRHATEKEMQEYFRKNEDFLKKEVSEDFNEILDRMKEETPKSSCHLLSVDDEELPMVNIIKTNSIKQLLNSE